MRPATSGAYAGPARSSRVPIARVPSCFFSDVVTRTKSSPSRAKIVAIAPLFFRNASGIV
ncbi:hypothetical protein FEP67_04995 [Burkholderia multivorans]|nr:hypothetical protein [Burkholderia multivorans]